MVEPYVSNAFENNMFEVHGTCYNDRNEIRSRLAIIGPRLKYWQAERNGIHLKQTKTNGF